MYKRRTPYLAFLSVFTFAAVLCCSDRGVGVGVGVANAKDFYTRKRVNGRWITGRFLKRITQSKLAIPAGAQATPVLPPITEQSAPPPAIQPIVGERPLAEPSGPPAAVVDAPAVTVEPPLTNDDRLLKLQEALLARAANLTQSVAGPREV
jgi:hypothetical protein